ncbi:hypothetical protein [Ktedonospora formicarum]|uniref:Uncharacterized protein n=1 Tax=Ktedonospora formicarum TaxID=2778364 RepID=A0A8J3IGA8_9CHLR|nr:hypothetical protein [Ktedonospora formicarum]GHO51319.1 hypothetical protein KSX_94820 [Ktedonospora formicarum]
MHVRVISLILRFCAIPALILGILFWIGLVVPTNALLSIHMLLGILVMLGLWMMSIAHFKSKPGLAISILLLSLIAIIFGITQENFFVLAPSLIWLIKLIHLLLVFGALTLCNMLTRSPHPTERKTTFLQQKKILPQDN